MLPAAAVGCDQRGRADVGCDRSDRVARRGLDSSNQDRIPAVDGLVNVQEAESAVLLVTGALLHINRGGRRSGVGEGRRFTSSGYSRLYGNGSDRHWHGYNNRAGVKRRTGGRA